MKRYTMIALAVSLAACGGSNNDGGVAATTTVSTAQITAVIPDPFADPAAPATPATPATAATPASPTTPAQPATPAAATPSTPPAQGATPIGTPTNPFPPLPADTAPADAAATAFFVTAYQEGLSEIELATLAASRSQDEHVREYAQVILLHHTVINLEIQSVAQAKRIILPTTTTQEQTSTATTLAGLSGLQFDREYMAVNVASHRVKAAQVMQVAAGTNDDNVRVFAVTGLPLTKTHLAFAEDILNQLDPAAFVATIYQSSQAEIAWAQVALERASDAGVRQYAQKMITEHTEANEQITRFARDKGLPLPGDLTEEQQAITQDLQRFSRADFDRVYMDTNVMAHLRATRYARTQMGSSGRDVDVRELARTLEPDLAGHLVNASELARQIEPSFTFRAYQSNLAEVGLAYLALGRSRDNGVITYAQRMLAEHLPVLAQLRQLAATANVPLPVELSPEGQLAYGTLAVIDDDVFNAGYAAYNTRLHDKAIELFSEETRTPDSTATLSFAQTLLPALTAHRDEARTLRSQFAGQILQLIQRLPVFAGGSMM